MSTRYKTYTPEFKAKVVKELIKEQKTLAELSSEYKIPVKTIQNWHQQFLNGIEAVFSQGKLEKKHKEELTAKDRKLEQAYKEIGSLVTQINWVKKKCNEIGFDCEKGND
jgi:transposase-like protein